MQNLNQQGRSMIEMLGVLAIVGVLTVGGLSIIGKARKQQELTQLLSEVAEVVNNTKKLSCQYDSGYKSYTQMLCQSDEYPKSVECSGSNENTIITTSSDVTVKIEAKTESEINYFVAHLENMEEDQCVYLASSDWGHRHSNGFIGAYFGDSAPSDLKDEPIDPGTAAVKCEPGAKLNLKYLGCQKKLD